MYDFMAAPQRQALGRGLAALLDAYPAEENATSASKDLIWLSPSSLSPNPLQPRTHFDEEQLENLAQSIREKGILQPLLIQKREDQEEGYVLIAGERRWRAAKKIGLTSIPCRIMSLDEQNTLEVALLENIQRDDLNALEEAQGYQLLMERFSYTQEDLSKKLGKSRSHIANRLRLLSLPEELKTMITEDQLSAGHAKALLSTQDPVALAHSVIKEKLSVRSTEQRARKQQAASMQGTPEDVSEMNNLANQLSQLVGNPVRIDMNAKGQSTLVFSFATVHALEVFIENIHRGFTHV